VVNCRTARITGLLAFALGEILHSVGWKGVLPKLLRFGVPSCIALSFASRSAAELIGRVAIAAEPAGADLGVV